MSGWIDDPIKPLCPYPINYIEYSSFKFLMNYDGSSFYLTFLKGTILIDRIIIAPSNIPKCYYVKLFIDGEKNNNLYLWSDYVGHKQAYDKAIEIAQKYLALI